MAFLDIKNVDKIFGSFEAVKDFDLGVEKGELVTFLGPSGCGKTTTLRMVAGFEVPDRGQILLDGTDVTGLPPNKRDVGMVFQAYALFPNMTVAQNIGFGLRVRREADSTIRQRVDEMLSLIHLGEKGSSYPHQLSGGQQQRVALARALAIHPRVLLLDEPLSALDAKIRVSLRAEIRAIQKDLGITAIYVTHDQEEALSISDRIVVMYSGRIEQVGTPFEVYNFPTTTFVAGFVGTLNTTEAEVVDPKSQMLRLEGQNVQAETGLEKTTVGQKVRIAIRPERFNFASAEKKANVFDCTVKTITFLGSIVRVQVQIGGQEFFMDEFNNPFLELPPVGSKTQVTCSRQAVLILNQ